jgi:hypothetical protein
VAKASGVSPSSLLNLKAWASALIGMEDTWTPMQFDAAVSYFGVWVENRMNSFDPKTGQARYRLEDLLSDAPPVPSWEALFAKLGIAIRTV